MDDTQAMSVVTLMPGTKKEQKIFYHKVKNEIMNGNYDPLQLAVYLKSITETIKLINNDYEIKEAILNEANKYPEKTNSVYNAEVSVCQRSTYKYETDFKYLELQQQMEEIKQKIKDREKLLKSLKPGNQLVDPDTGELLTPPVQMTTEYLKIAFKEEVK